MFLEHGTTRLIYHNTTITRQRIFRTRLRVFRTHMRVFKTRIQHAKFSSALFPPGLYSKAAARF